MRKIGYSVLTFGCIAGCMLPTDRVETDLGNDEIGSTDQPLVGGTASTQAPEVGRYINASGGGCTATLIGPHFALTAAHCLQSTDHQQGGGGVGGSFITESPANIRAVLRARSFSSHFRQIHGDGEGHSTDLAVLWLASDITNITPATIAASYPSSGAPVVHWGYGCNVRDPQSGGGTKRFFEFSYPTSPANCPGDSGGPARFGLSTSGGNIWGVNSGHTVTTPVVSVFASAVGLRSRIQALMSPGGWDSWSEWFPTTEGYNGNEGDGEIPSSTTPTTLVTGAGNVGVWWTKADGSLWRKFSGPGPNGWNPAVHSPSFQIHSGATSQYSSGNLAASSDGSGRASIFYRTSNGRIRSTYYPTASTPPAWSAPFDIAPAGAISSGQIVAISAGAGNTAVFWFTSTGTLRESFKNVSLPNWVTNLSIANVTGVTDLGSLTGVSPYTGATSLFWRRSDGAIDSTWYPYNGNQWRPIQANFPIAPPGTLPAGSKLTAVTSDVGAVSLFWVNANGAVCTMYFEPTTGLWSGVATLTGTGAAPAGSRVTAVSTHTRAVSIFYVSALGQMWSTYYDPLVSSTWATPFAMSETGRFSSGEEVPAVSPRQGLSGGLVLHYSSPSGAIWSKFYDGR